MVPQLQLHHNKHRSRGDILGDPGTGKSRYIEKLAFRAVYNRARCVGGGLTASVWRDNMSEWMLEGVRWYWPTAASASSTSSTR